MHQTMKNLFEIQKSLTLSMISLQGHRGVSSGLGYHKQAPLSGLPIRYHFRVTRESIPTVFSQTTNSLYSSRTVAIAENRLPRNRCLPFALSTMLTKGSGIGSISVLQSLGERHYYYSTKSFVKKVISTLSCCLKPAADVTADQTGELSALQAMTRQVEVDITSGLAEEITSQQITVYHTGEASTSQTLPVTRPKLSLFHSLMRQQITGPCEQQKESFIVAELAKRFIPTGPRFSLCEEYMQVIGLRDKCEKGTEDEFKFLSLCPSLTWYGWLYRETQKQKTGAEYEEIRFCLNEIRNLSQESLYSCVFLHPLLECLVKESSKRAFSFEPTFEKACEVLHTREILSPTQERHHALKFRDLLNELAHWEKRVMAAALHIPASILRSNIGLEPEPRIAPLGKVEVFLHRLMLEAQETLQIRKHKKDC